jgi:hypothetical protein
MKSENKFSRNFCKNMKTKIFVSTLRVRLRNIGFELENLRELFKEAYRILPLSGAFFSLVIFPTAHLKRQSRSCLPTTLGIYSGPTRLPSQWKISSFYNGSGMKHTGPMLHMLASHRKLLWNLCQLPLIVSWRTDWVTLLWCISQALF